jgi:LTXXQ motif family protein
MLASTLALAIGSGALARGGGGHGGGGHGGGGHGGGGHGGGRFGGGHFGGRGFGGHDYGHRGFGYRHFAGRQGIHAAHFAGRHFAHDLHNFHNRNFRGGFGYGYGWYGPVFWPYAYDDIFDDILWGFGLGGPFWGYGYGDLYGALFSPHGYGDLAGFLPSVQGTPSSPPQGRQAVLSNQIGQMCGDDLREVAGWPIDRIQRATAPTPEQQAALDEFADATIQAAQTIKGACPTNVAFAPGSRLETMQKRIEGMARAVDIVGPPLNRFYNMLNDEQKAALNAANEEERRKRGSLATCGAATNATQWPGDQIEKAVRPDPDQQAKLDALKNAMVKASDDLTNACPAALPATPPARLAAISRRLDAMLLSVRNVRAALDDFYNSLSDEQKVQFNMIGRQRAAGR